MVIQAAALALPAVVVDALREDARFDEPTSAVVDATALPEDPSAVPTAADAVATSPPKAATGRE